MRVRTILFLIVVTAALAVLSVAQVTTGTLSGTITDSSGAVIPNAKIEVSNQDTGLSRTLTADSAGRYDIPQLPAGRYNVTFNAEGFQTQVRNGITLTVGE